MTDLSADDLAASIVNADASSAPPKAKGKMLPTIAAVGILTLIAIGGGAGMGMLIGSAKPVEPAAPAPAEDAKAIEAEAAESSNDEGTPLHPTVLVKLAPVVTNVATPPKTMVRVEAALVLHPEAVENVEVLAAQIQADTLAFLRTIDLAQIEGSRGLLHLREDLKERAQLRSPAVTDYLIQSMVAQ